MRPHLPMLLAMMPALGCGDDTSTAAADSSTTGDPGSSSTTATAGPETEDASEGGESSTTGPMPCAGDEDCGAGGTPFCEPVSGECVSCAGTDDPNGACAELDPTMPLCVGGACVQCTEAAPEACVGVTPVCDDASNSCVACTEHGQCGEAACNFYTGACLPGDAVVHVGPGQDFATLGAAVASFGAGAEGTIVVHQASYIEAVTIDGGRVLAFLAANDVTASPIWAETSEDRSQLEVAEDSTAIIDGLRISGNLLSTQPAVRVDGGRAWVDRSRIVQNSGGGVLAQGGAELVLRNCFVGSLGDVIGVEVVEASAAVLYSTISASTFGATPALGCTSPVDVELRNSIAVTQGGMSPDELSCAGATVVNSATEADVGAFSSGWFVDYNGGNFHLTASGATTFAGLGEWHTGDPATDIDGELRPTEDGTPDYAGADIP